MDTISYVLLSETFKTSKETKTANIILENILWGNIMVFFAWNQKTGFFLNKTRKPIFEFTFKFHNFFP